MKVNSVGNVEDALLWPSDTASTTNAQSISPAAAGLFDDTAHHSSDLLWPAELINQQARLRKQRNYTLPFAIATFALSCILGLIVGPLQLIMIATTNDFNWVTTIFYNSLLHYVLPIAGLLAIFNIAILVWLWLQPTLKQRTILALVLSSLIELGAIWIFGYFNILPPPQLMLVLLAIAVICFLAVLFINKQYVATPDLDFATRIIIAIFAIIALVQVIVSGVYLFGNTTTQDTSEIEHLSALQLEARVEAVPALLSDLAFTVCNNSKYQVVYLDQAQTAGLFECTSTGEVYSVAEYDSVIKDTITGAATYLGTTKDKNITLAFPNTYYLYRSLPDALSEDELALMFPATSEQELIDNLAPLLFNYWQEHSDHNLFLNVFYNPDFNQLTGTRDYILMSALGTMVMVEGLPRGLTLAGVAEGKAATYLYHADTELKALNELGALPENYAASTREALMTNRHLALHLAANESLDYDTLVARLWESFTGGAE